MQWRTFCGVVVLLAAFLCSSAFEVSPTSRRRVWQTCFPCLHPDLLSDSAPEKQTTPSRALSSPHDLCHRARYAALDPAIAPRMLEIVTGEVGRVGMEINLLKLTCFGPDPGFAEGIQLQDLWQSCFAAQQVTGKKKNK